MASIPRFLLPRGLPTVYLRLPEQVSKPSFDHAFISSIRSRRHASSSTSRSKAATLAKPSRYNPPSHPARSNAVRPPRNYPGPPPSAAQEVEQKTKRYPNSFPAEGTKMFWFLTNKMVHMWLTLVRWDRGKETKRQRRREKEEDGEEVSSAFPDLAFFGLEVVEDELEHEQTMKASFRR